MSGATNDRAAIAGILAVSAAAFGFLVWLIYFKTPAASSSSAYDALPAVNAILNGLSACCLTAGYLAIRAKRRRVHMTLMITAFVFSALFLVSYIVYHNVHGDTKFLGEGAIRTVYFSILISHIGVTVFALPMIFTTFYFAYRQRFDTHRRLARLTLPLWMYVSVTGVAIYFLLKAHS